MQGRVFALITSAGYALTPLGLVIAGPVADSLGVPFWWVVAGLVIATASVGALFVQDLVHLESRAPRLAMPSA
jgi:MFS transporter, DHA3 family, macrolide efflux protein